MANKFNIVLVHGAWADGSSWSKVIPLLKEAGYNVVAAQNPMTSLYDDAEVTRRLVEAQEGPVLLVGHSYGGDVITEAAPQCPNVVGLVYIAAFAPDTAESITSLSSGSEPSPGTAAIRPDQYGMLWIDRDHFAEDFCQDVDKTEAAAMAATQHPIAAKNFDDKVTRAGWKNLRSWYLVSGNDRMIPPQAQQFMAQRINATTVTVPFSHASMVSHPVEVADFILSAAKELELSTAEETALH